MKFAFKWAPMSAFATGERRDRVWLEYGPLEQAKLFDSITDALTWLQVYVWDSEHTNSGLTLVGVELKPPPVAPSVRVERPLEVQP